MRCSGKLQRRHILAFDVYECIFCWPEVNADEFADNHKPDSFSESSMQLQPTDSNQAAYDLSFSDHSDKYKYNGVRTTGDGKYVLIFDSDKKHFVLHRIDSTFDMNLVSAPWEKNASTLRSQYPQLESAGKLKVDPLQRKPSKSSKSAPTPAAKVEPKRRKSTQTKKKPPVREPTPDEDDESDDGLTVEYPDAPPSRQNQNQTTPTIQHNDSEEISDEDEDAEGEEYEEERNQDVDHLKLPSPANNNAGGMSDEDIELDLEAELEQALNADESDESEEE